MVYPLLRHLLIQQKLISLLNEFLNIASFFPIQCSSSSSNSHTHTCQHSPSEPHAILLHFCSREHTVVNAILSFFSKKSTMSNRLKRKKASNKSASKCPICGEFFVGLVLHLQRSECVAIACNANVPQVPHDIAFKRAAIDNQHDEDQWELHSNDDESFMGVNDNTEKANAEKDKIIGTGKNDDSDNENEMYDNNASQSNSSDVESFHEEMDWYHVLEYHENYTKRKKNRAIVEERIEEYEKNLCYVLSLVPRASRNC